MRMTLRSMVRGATWPIIAAMGALMIIGVLAIGAAERAEGIAPNGLHSNMVRQALFVPVALVAFVVAAHMPYHRLGRWIYPLYIVTLVMLALLLIAPYVPIPLIEPRKGAYRWIGVQELSIQPSEVAKISFILLLAWSLRYGFTVRSLRGLIGPFLLTLLPMFMVLKQPDLGTSLLFLPTLYCVLFMAGAKWQHLAVILILGSVAVFAPVPRPVDAPVFAEQQSAFVAKQHGPVTLYSVREDLSPGRRPYTPVAYCRYRIGDGGMYDLQPLSVALMKDHQISRVEGWLRQEDPQIIQGKGFQLHWSKMILGSGCLAGRGDWSVAESFFSVLPEDHTDFVFSVIGGQWGFLGCVGVLALFGVIFVLGVEIAAATDEPFGRLLAVGVLALLFSQLIINVGMTMGLMPVTGMTLPLVSYGGSSLVVNCIALGLLVNVGQHRPIVLGRKPFEYN